MFYADISYPIYISGLSQVKISTFCLPDWWILPCLQIQHLLLFSHIGFRESPPNFQVNLNL